MSLNIPSSSLPRVVIVGGGFAGLSIVKHLRKTSCQVILMDKNNYHIFQPLLYQVATGGLEVESVAFPLRRFVRNFKNAIFRMAEVKEIKPAENILVTNIGDINYDYLVLATGSEANFFGNEGIAKHAMAMKSIPQTEDLRTVILQNLEKAAIAVTAEDRLAYMNFVIAGGGPTGVEMAGALNEMKKHIFTKDYPELDLGQMTITVIEAADRLLSVMSDNASRKALQFLEKSGVKVLLNVKLLDYDGNTVTLDKVSPINAKTLIWTAGVKGTVPGRITEKSIVRGNRIKVNSFNQMEGLQNVFAIGDVASLTDEKNPNGLPMVAQVAIQEGKQLAENIHRSLNKKQMIPFAYRDKGSMAIVSRNKAVADLHRFRFHGMFAWLIWTFVHLMSIVGFRNRLVVFVDWVWSYISYDRALRNIIRPYKEKQE